MNPLSETTYLQKVHAYQAHVPNLHKAETITTIVSVFYFSFIHLFKFQTKSSAPALKPLF